MSNDIYNIINESNYDIIKTIFIDAVEHDTPKEKVLENLIQKAGLTMNDAVQLYGVEIGLIQFRK